MNAEQMNAVSRTLGTLRMALKKGRGDDIISAYKALPICVQQAIDEQIGALDDLFGNGAVELNPKPA